ncbi:glutathione S-transferase family protein [Corallococcus carmarthensis]|uniref:glutathione transferase n=1 Tax=Corallococcus carmarthensis TaxID=2316728 RepID=A0A3A8KFK6_9BACT|nr:glutathione S-transferase [Corallococcus carmarthensis]NOK16338.1 glutathione S-transferase [Corallococcus carmarthensis]RKH01242.1 glutathione S-transferase [Corallococcus carmarthensis]
MLKVHHLERSRSHRVLWLLEELGLPYEVVHYSRDPKTLLAPPELAQVHPLGKSPVLTDGDATIAESAAILEYLVERHGGGRFTPPPGTPEALRYRYFLHYAEGSLMPPLLVALIAQRIRKAPVPFFLKPVTGRIGGTLEQQLVRPNLTRHVGFLEAELARSPWFAGEAFSVADIQMSYPVEALLSRGDTTRMVRLKDFLARIRERPAYQRAVERGGPTFLE